MFPTLSTAKKNNNKKKTFFTDVFNLFVIFISVFGSWHSKNMPVGRDLSLHFSIPKILLLMSVLSEKKPLAYVFTVTYCKLL